MLAITLQDAKAKLNSLVEKASQGEEVILLKGSKVVAMIKPISEKDIQLIPEISDDQAQVFWDSIAEEKSDTFDSMNDAVKHLNKRLKKHR